MKKAFGVRWVAFGDGGREEELTQASRTRVFTRAANAFSSTLVWAALSPAQAGILVEEMTARSVVIRKGRAPVGEAWLLEATVSTRMLRNLRYAWSFILARSRIGGGRARLTCHFKQVGLKLGASVAASAAKTWRVGTEGAGGAGDG